jgi:hypothetical protein
MILERLIVEITGDTKGVDKALTGTQTAMKGLATLAMRLAPYIGLGAIAREIVTNSIASQRAIAQLGAVVKSTGGVAGRSVGQLQEMATALSKVSTSGSKAIMAGQSMLLMFTNIRGKTFDDATKAVLDLATAMASSGGGEPDLASAAQLVGKALQDPITGSTMLRRAGVILSEQQQQAIKDFMALNDVASAQGVILKQLAVQTGGSAAAMKNTLGGALGGLSSAWNGLFVVSQESSAGIVRAINGITNALPKLRDALNTVLSVGQQLASGGPGLVIANIMAGSAKAAQAAKATARAAGEARYRQFIGRAGGGGGALTDEQFKAMLNGMLPEGVALAAEHAGMPGALAGRIQYPLPPGASVMPATVASTIAGRTRVSWPTPELGPWGAGLPSGTGFNGQVGPWKEMGGGGALSKLGGAFSAGLDKATGMLTQFGPAAMIAGAAMEVLGGVMEPLAPVIEMLKAPLAAIGRIIGVILLPVLKPLAFAFSYVMQALGWFIEGLGKVIDKLLPDWISHAGQGLAKEGQNMQDEAKRLRSEFGKTADAADKLNEALRNIPTGLKVAFNRFQATAVGGTGTTGGGGGGGYGGGGGGGGGGGNGDNSRLQESGAASFTGNTFILPGVRSAEDFFNEMERVARQRTARGGFAFGT